MKIKAKLLRQILVQHLKSFELDDNLVLVNPTEQGQPFKHCLLTALLGILFSNLPESE